MKIWLDTIDFETIAHAQRLGILSGVTTNPAILGNACEDVDSLLHKLLDVQSGNLAVQVISDDAKNQVMQARKIARISDRIIVKVPAIGDGFLAIAELEKDGIKTLATNIFELRQIVMACLVGAHYAAPYINRISQSTGNAFELLADAQKIIECYDYHTHIMGASIKTHEQFVGCAKAGIGAITLPAETYRQIFSSNPDINSSLADFKRVWQTNLFTSQWLPES